MGKRAISFKEDFITNCDGGINKGYILEVEVELSKIQKNCLIFIMIYHFYQNERILKNVMSLLVTCMTQKTMSFT